MKHQYCLKRIQWLQYGIVLLSSIFCHNLYAEQANTAYEFELTPYLWAASLSGTTTVDGNESPPIDTDYNFFSLDNLDGVASATFKVRKNHWKFLFDFLYVAYEDTLLEATTLQTKPRLEGLILEYAGAFTTQSFANLELIAGIRQQYIEASLEILNQTPRANVDWFDPFVGVIYVLSMGKNTSVEFRGDLGGFGIESDLAINTAAILRYELGKVFSLKFGYRYLKVKFDESDFVYDLALDGFLLGAGMRF